MKKKILLLSDDLRMTSGVATMSKEIVLGTLHKYDWVQLGAAISHPEYGKIMDITDQLFLDGNPGGIKFALSLLKKCDHYVRLPLSEPNKKVKDELKRLVKNYK